MLCLIVPDKCYINNLTEQLSVSNLDSPFCTTLYKSNINNHDFLIMETGYGKVNISRGIQYLIDNYKVSVLVLVGTCGSINDSNDIFSAVVYKNTLQFDVDFMPLGYNPGCIPKMKSSIYNTNEDLLECMNDSCKKSFVNYSNDLIASSDMFVSNNNLASSIRREYAACAVDCESGAVGEMAYLNKIPFVGLKIISNYAGNNAVKQYKLYDDNASNISNKIIYKFLKSYYS